MAELVQSDPNAMLRSEAVAVLGELGGPTAITALKAAISDNDQEVRIAACRAWSRMHTEEAMDLLAQVVERDADVDVRMCAIAELGTFKDASAVQALGKALDDNDPAVQQRAVAALQQATGRNFGDSVPAWRDFVEGREPPSSATPSIVQRFLPWY
jgi:HEAT repeat protein